MIKNPSFLTLLGILLLSLALLLSSCGITPETTPPATNPPSPLPTDEPQVGPTESQVTPTETPAVSDGQALMEQRCSVCHSTSRITSKHATLDQWTAIVDRMINKGAELNADDRQILIDYLAQTYP